MSTLPTKSSARVWWPGIQPCLQLGSRLEGGQGVPVSGCLTPGIQHRLPPPWCSSSPQGDQSRVPVRKWGPLQPWPPRLAPWVSPKKFGDDIAKATGDQKGLRLTVELTVQNTQAQTSQPSRNHAGTERSRKTLSTLEISLLIRLSTLPDRCTLVFS